MKSPAVAFCVSGEGTYFAPIRDQRVGDQLCPSLQWPPWTRLKAVIRNRRVLTRCEQTDLFCAAGSMSIRRSSWSKNGSSDFARTLWSADDLFQSLILGLNLSLKCVNPTSREATVSGDVFFAAIRDEAFEHELLVRIE